MVRVVRRGRGGMVRESELGSEGLCYKGITMIVIQYDFGLSSHWSVYSGNDDDIFMNALSLEPSRLARA